MLKLEIENMELVRKTCHALSTELRLKIIKLLQNEKMSCLALSKVLGYPLSTISNNVKILEDAHLILSETIPAKNGYQKICSLVYSDIHIYFAEYIKRSAKEKVNELEIPIGSYMDCLISPTCGFLTLAGATVQSDDPSAFYHHSRVNAELIWFRQGWLEYKIPYHTTPELKLKEIRISMEICSEAPGYNLDWKSDITLWLNQIEIGTWTSPSDFGGKKGEYTPEFWKVQNTQYGLITRWSIDKFESYINFEPVSTTSISDLNLEENNYLALRLGVKEEAKHVGGINLFGKKFGNHPQGILLQFIYE